MESLWYLQAYVILNTNFEYSMKWQNARRGAGRFLGDLGRFARKEWKVAHNQGEVARKSQIAAPNG